MDDLIANSMQYHLLIWNNLFFIYVYETKSPTSETNPNTVICPNDGEQSKNNDKQQQ